MSTAPSQTAAANQARRKRTEDKLRAVADAIQQMQRRRLPVTYPAIASRAGVSRTFLYDNPAARDLISAAIARTATRRQHDQADRDAQAEASWQQRALNAEQALKTAHAGSSSNVLVVLRLDTCAFRSFLAREWHALEIGDPRSRDIVALCS